MVYTLSWIIPAYAGQILLINTQLKHLWDHPRIRGTNKSHKIFNHIPEGSSPHTRDKYVLMLAMVGLSRIIPAYAGQMFQEENGNIEIRDHPRIRGTNVFIPWVLSKLEGSSPHTRDKLGAKYKIIGQLRIIPAYAGQMEITPSSSRENSDHPRIRGTNE